MGHSILERDRRQWEGVRDDGASGVGAIGGFAAAMLGTHTVITTSFTRTLRAEIGTDRC
ncbi:MAG: hypothetical protein ACSLE3_05600 [Microbacteriaceae bacterium]